MTTPSTEGPVSQERHEAQSADRLHEWYTLEDRPRARSAPRALSPPGWTPDYSTRGASMGGPSLTSTPVVEQLTPTRRASSSEPVLGRSVRAPKAPGVEDPEDGVCLGPPNDLLWPQPAVQTVMTAGASEPQSHPHLQTDDSDLFSFLAGSRPERTPEEGGLSGFEGRAPCAGWLLPFLRLVSGRGTMSLCPLQRTECS